MTEVTSTPPSRWSRQVIGPFTLRHLVVLALHLNSADTYKDYPRMPELVGQLTQVGTVFIFHSEPIVGFEMEEAVKVDSLPLRRAIAVAAMVGR